MIFDLYLPIYIISFLLIIIVGIMGIVEFIMSLYNIIQIFQIYWCTWYIQYCTLLNSSLWSWISLVVNESEKNHTTCVMLRAESKDGLHSYWDCMTRHDTNLPCWSSAQALIPLLLDCLPIGYPPHVHVCNIYRRHRRSRERPMMFWSHDKSEDTSGRGYEIVGGKVCWSWRQRKNNAVETLRKKDVRAMVRSPGGWRDKIK